MLYSGSLQAASQRCYLFREESLCLRVFLSVPKRGQASLGSGASLGFGASNETPGWGLLWGSMGMVVMGHQPAGSMAKHEMFRESGLGGWRGEFRVACNGLGSNHNGNLTGFPSTKESKIAS